MVVDVPHDGGSVKQIGIGTSCRRRRGASARSRPSPASTPTRCSLHRLRRARASPRCAEGRRRRR
jgi:hypothetical protein